MKQTLTALLVVSLFATIVALAADKPPAKSDADILVARINADYATTIREADKFYAKYAAPYMKARDKKVLAAGNTAIRRLNAARKQVSELEGVRLEKEIARIRKSLDKQFGDVPKITPKMSVMKACGTTFKGHTYLAIASVADRTQAAAMCKKMGGHLVYIETQEELAFLRKMFRERFWVGATDAHMEGDWRWGNGKPVAKDLWLKDEPSDNNKTENFAELLIRGERCGLNDLPVECIGVIGFICEWE
jgi:hypothetical protein